MLRYLLYLRKNWVEVLIYQQVETALNNVRVLDEMLSRHQESPASQPDLDLMLELHSSCASLRANLYRLVSEMDDKDEGIGK